MSLNKIVTSVNSLASSITLPVSNIDDVVCIDTINNRIGVKTSNPTKEIDVNGSVRTSNLLINHLSNLANDYDISYSNAQLKFSNGININGDSVFSNDLQVTNQLKVAYDLDVTSYIGKAAIGWNGTDNNVAAFSHRVHNTDNNYCLTQDSNGITRLNAPTGQTIYFSIDDTPKMTLATDGTVGIFTTAPDTDPNIKLDVNGRIKSTHQDLITSDDRLKHNEKNINNGLNIVRQLNPQFYQKTQTFKTHDYMGPVNEPYILEAGLIAQEVANINDISFAVSIGNDVKPYSVAYNNIFIYGLAAIKELDTIVNTNINNIKDISNNMSKLTGSVNLGNIENFIKNQNLLIQNLNAKIANLETKINNLEKK